MNSFNGIGRIGRDAVTRQTGNGKPVTGWPLAIDVGWGDKKTTLWLDCTLWGDRGQKLSEYLTKGAQIGVTGEIGTREHEGKTYVTLNVDNVTLVGKPKEAAATPAPAAKAKAASELEDDIPF
jgi:single-strand DNA-binding protein